MPWSSHQWSGITSGNLHTCRTEEETDKCLQSKCMQKKYFSVFLAMWAEDPTVASRHLRLKRFSFLLPHPKKETMFDFVLLELALIELSQIFLMSIWKTICSATWKLWHHIVGPATTLLRKDQIYLSLYWGHPSGRYCWILFQSKIIPMLALYACSYQLR